MQQCQFGIAPASTILYELSCVKLPVLSGYYVENQRRIYEGFLNNGAIFGGGDFTDYTTSSFREKINSILEIDNFRVLMNAQSKLFDSKIRTRHLEIVNSIC